MLAPGPVSQLVAAADAADVAFLGLGAQAGRSRWLAQIPRRRDEGEPWQVLPVFFLAQRGRAGQAGSMRATWQSRCR
jgi:hypothetical protein